MCVRVCGCDQNDLGNIHSITIPNGSEVAVSLNSSLVNVVHTSCTHLHVSLSRIRLFKGHPKEVCTSLSSTSPSSSRPSSCHSSFVGGQRVCSWLTCQVKERSERGSKMCKIICDSFDNIDGCHQLSHSVLLEISCVTVKISVRWHRHEGRTHCVSSM